MEGRSSIVDGGDWRSFMGRRVLGADQLVTVQKLEGHSDTGLLLPCRLQDPIPSVIVALFVPFEAGQSLRAAAVLVVKLMVYLLPLLLA